MQRALPGACDAGDVRTPPGALAALGSVDVDVARACGAQAGPPVALLPAPVAGALRALRAARQASRAIVVLHAAGAPALRLLAIAGGRLDGAVSANGSAELAAAFGRIAGRLARPLPTLLPREALDEVRLVTGWLAGPEGRAAAIDFGRLGPAAAWRRVVARAELGPLFSSGDRSAPG